MSKLQNNISTLKKAINNSLDTALEEIGVSGVADLQANAPVKTGNLRRSLTFKKANSKGVYTITLGTKISYAPATEFRNKSKGWFRDTLRSLEVEKILRSHLGGV